MSNGVTQMTAGRDRQQPALKMRRTEEPPQYGLLSHTLVSSPVVRQILPCRLRDASRNDLVFVGFDFIHVKEFRSDGRLTHVATKADFPAAIRAARVFGEPRGTHPEVKQENGNGYPAAVHTSLLPPNFPPQVLLLTLTNSEVWMLCLREAPTVDSSHFCISRQALPSRKSPLDRPGKHVAVDFKSRAFAIAASQGTVLVYSTERRAIVPSQSHDEPRTWMPIKDERLLSVDGTIVRMEFLHPAIGDDNHIILLLLHYNYQALCATCWDFDAAQGLVSLQKRIDGNRFSEDQQFPQLLIPMNSGSSFILISRDQLKLYKNLLSGDITAHDISPMASPNGFVESLLWTNWVRMPRLGYTIEHYYLVREDGAIGFMEVEHRDKESRVSVGTNVGKFDGCIGTAFAGVPAEPNEPDYLIAAGDGSNGALLAIGYRNGAPLGNQRRSDVMTPWTVEPLLNWAPVSDLTVNHYSTHEGEFGRSRDELLITTGKQPSGSLSVVKHGITTKAFSVVVDLSELELHGVTGLWMVSSAQDSFIALLASTPSHSLLFRVELADDNGEEVIELTVSPPDDDERTWAVERERPTLAAGHIPVNRYIQITTEAVTLYDATVNDQIGSWSAGPGANILLADLDARGLHFTVVSRVDAKTMVHSGDFDPAMDHVPPVGEGVCVQQNPTCITSFRHDQAEFVVVATREGDLLFFRRHATVGLQPLGSCTIAAGFGQPNSQTPAACESIAFFASLVGTPAMACGMRDGSIIAAEVNFEAFVLDPNAMDVDQTTPVSLQHICRWSFSKYEVPVRLCHTDVGIIATSGTNAETWLLERVGEEGCRVNVQCLWLDRTQHATLKGAGMNHFLTLPHKDTFEMHGLSRSLLSTYGDTIVATWPSAGASTAVERIWVDGTPNRVVPDARGNALVASTITYGEEGIESLLTYVNPRVEGRSDGSTDLAILATHRLAEAEAVSALHFWKIQLGNGKSYPVFVVGTRKASEGTGIKGRLHFYTTSVVDGQVLLKKQRSPKDLEGPVTSITSVGNRLIVAAGAILLIKEMVTANGESRLQDMASTSMLRSPAVHVTCREQADVLEVRVSTVMHGFRTLRLEEHPSSETGWALRETSHEEVARQSLNHIDWLTSDGLYTLTSDKMNNITLLQTSNERAVSDVARTVFSVSLPRAITRLRHAHVRPGWLLPIPSSESQPAAIIGTSADGTVYSLALLILPEFHLLKILEQLVVLRKHTRGPIGERSAKLALAAKRKILLIGAMLLGEYEADRVPSEGSWKDYHVNADLLSEFADAEDVLGRIEELLSEVDGVVQEDGAKTVESEKKEDQPLRWIWDEARRKFEKIAERGSVEVWLKARLVKPF